MPLEIERKFLVHHELWNSLEKPKPILIKQAYISTDKTKTIRLRLKNEKAFLTLKGETRGISRTEFEYEIPAKEAEEMIFLFCDKKIEKKRYEITHAEKLWEVDVFEGENLGLIVAEIELKSEAEELIKPYWIANEVSSEAKYYNANLLEMPFYKW